MSDRAQRVALVTGGSRGLGAAICFGLAEDGFRVAVNWVRNAEHAESVVGEIRAMGGEAIPVQGSVASADDNVRMVEEVVHRMGGLDTLVHNAGIASRGNPVAQTDRDEVVRLLDVHAIGPHALTRLALPHLRAADRADVVFVSSIATRHHRAGGAPYNMAKAAMESLAFTLAKEELENGIHVNVLAPGLMLTDMGRRLVTSWQVDEVASFASSSPFGHVLLAEEAADIVRFFVSSQARYLTGERIYLDGQGVAPTDM